MVINFAFCSLFCRTHLRPSRQCHPARQHPRGV